MFSKTDDPIPSYTVIFGCVYCLSLSTEQPGLRLTFPFFPSNVCIIFATTRVQLLSQVTLSCSFLSPHLSRSSCSLSIPLTVVLAASKVWLDNGCVLGSRRTQKGGRHRRRERRRAARSNEMCIPRFSVVPGRSTSTRTTKRHGQKGGRGEDEMDARWWWWC